MWLICRGENWKACAAVAESMSFRCKLGLHRWKPGTSKNGKDIAVCDQCGLCRLTEKVFKERFVFFCCEKDAHADDRLSVRLSDEMRMSFRICKCCDLNTDSIRETVERANAEAKAKAKSQQEPPPPG